MDKITLNCCLICTSLIALVFGHYFKYLQHICFLCSEFAELFFQVSACLAHSHLSVLSTNGIALEQSLSICDFSWWFSFSSPENQIQHKSQPKLSCAIVIHLLPSVFQTSNHLKSMYSMQTCIPSFHAVPQCQKGSCIQYLLNEPWLNE